MYNIGKMKRMEFSKQQPTFNTLRSISSVSDSSKTEPSSFLKHRDFGLLAIDVESSSSNDNAKKEEREGEEDLLKAISESLPENDGTSLDTLGQDLYMEWMLQAMNTFTVKVSNSPFNDLKLWLWKTAAGEFDKSSVEAEIERILASAPMVVFGASYSPFTKKALNTLQKVGANYRYVPLESLQNSVAIRAQLAERTGRTSLPSIWLNNRFIGGCYDGPVGGVASMKRQELNTLLQEANALR